MDDKIAKFKIMAGVMVLALISLASCEIPQSVRVKASPTLQIPIPMGEGLNNSFIHSYTNIEEIREKLKDQAEQGKGISIYDYESTDLMEHFGIERPEGGNPAQTYLITYPLFDIDLNFNQYLNGTLLDTDKSRVPEVDISIEISNRVAETVERATQWGSIESGDLPYIEWIDPFMGNSPEVYLGDMKNLVSDITFETDTGFSIIVDPKNADMLQKAIRIRIPQLKIGDEWDRGKDSWVKGVLKEGNTKLVFKSADIDPDEPLLLLSDGTDSGKKIRSEKVEVHVRLVNKANAGKYKTELNFNWYSADVKSNNKDPREFKGFNLGSYLNSLGSGAKFEKVPAYLYVSTPSNSNINGFTIEIDTASPEESFLLQRKHITSENGEALPSWLDKPSTSNYDFTDTINRGDSINYKVIPPDAVTLYRNKIENETNQKITVYLAVLLPMVFKFTGDGIQISDDPDTGENESGYYFPINFQGLDDFLGNGSGSNSGGKSVLDDINEQLGDGGVNSLTLRFRDIDNKITSPIYLAVVTDTTIVANPGPGDWEIVKIASDAEDRDIDIKNVISLTGLPPIKFLVKDEKGQGGRLYIQSKDDANSSAFSVKISVIAGIDLDKKL
jgi:hypothetical protein